MVVSEWATLDTKIMLITALQLPVSFCQGICCFINFCWQIIVLTLLIGDVATETQCKMIQYQTIWLWMVVASYRQGGWVDSRGAWGCFGSPRLWSYQVLSIPYCLPCYSCKTFHSFEGQISVWVLFAGMRIWKTTGPLITLSTLIKCWIYGWAKLLGLP